MIYEGASKQEAFERVFPDRYNNAKSFAVSKNRNVGAMIGAAITTYESGKYVSKLYGLGREEYWKRFIHKKTKLLDKAFDKAMDDKADNRTQLGFMKVFLDNVPDLVKDETIIVKHKISDDSTFLAKLQERKQLLLNSVDEIIDIEVQDEI